MENPQALQVCNKCLLPKPIIEFRKFLSNGKYHYIRKTCKLCESKKSVNWAKKNIAQKIKNNNKYFSSSLGKKCIKEKTAQYRLKNPDKYKANMIVQISIRNGALLRKPCEVCGAIRSQAHHDNYLEPLKVRWLCAKHHIEEHKMLAQRKKDK